MADKENLIEVRIADLLEQKYTDSDKDKGINLLNEQDDDKPAKNTKKNRYKQCFKEVLQKEKKSIPKMTDKEKGDFFKRVKEKCKNS